MLLAIYIMVAIIMIFAIKTYVIVRNELTSREEKYAKRQKKTT